jgi:PAS domain S-box-containing protein
MEMHRRFIEYNFTLTNYEIELNDAKGEKHSLLSNYWGIIENDMLVGLWVLDKDITFRKEIEAKLKESEEKYRKLFESSPAYYVAINKNGEVIMMNETMLDSVGYTFGEVLNQNYISKFVPEDEKQLLSDIFEKLTNSDKPTNNKNHILTKDGRELLVEWNGRPILDNKGEFDYFFGLGIDITEEKLKELKIQEDQEIFNIIDEQSNIGIIIIQDFKIKYVNKGFTDMSGYSENELFSMEWDEIMRIPLPEYRNKIDDQIRKKLSGVNDYITQIDSKLKTKSGKIKALREFSKPITFQNRRAVYIMLTEIDPNF